MKKIINYRKNIEIKILNLYKIYVLNKVSHKQNKIMNPIFTITAALTLEKGKKQPKEPQVLHIAIEAENLSPVQNLGKRQFSFECKSFGIVEEFSSPNWRDVFSYDVDGDKVVFNVPTCFVVGQPTPGHL